MNAGHRVTKSDGSLTIIRDPEQRFTYSGELDPNLISAYLSTDYIVQSGAEEIRLNVGKRSPGLEAVLDANGAVQGTFITAWNPKGVSLSREENDDRNEALQRELRLISALVLLGYGVGHDGDWPPEESYLALDPTLDEACQLGRKYGQNAIIWFDRKCVPSLILLR